LSKAQRPSGRCVFLLRNWNGEQPQAFEKSLRGTD
jgi:hypothetical protein